MDKYIVADVGGTQIRVALFSGDNPQPDIVKKIRTHDKESTALARLMNLIDEIWPKEDKVNNIVVGVPGFLDHFSGLIYEAVNVPGWVQLPIGQILQDRFNTRVKIGNDANLASMGEWRYGAGQGHHNLLYLTISTGIGGGAIINDHLLLGERGLAAEFGHVTVIPDGPLCSCGQRGHLEAVASGTAIARFVTEKIALGYPSVLSSHSSINASDVSKAALENDQLALRAMNRAGTLIGFAIADFLHLLNPSIVILGGGVAQAGPLLIEPIKAALPERIMDRGYLENLIITTATLGDEVGLMGALAYARDVPDS
jgi:glucokinase